MDFPLIIIKIAIPLYAIYTAVKYYKSRLVKEYTAAEVAELLEVIPTCIVILDVRPPAGRVISYIPGSLHIPFYELSERMEELTKYSEKEIICCCSDGSLSVKIAFSLQQKGFNAAALLGGINAWKE